MPSTASGVGTANSECAAKMLIHGCGPTPDLHQLRRIISCVLRQKSGQRISSLLEESP